MKNAREFASRRNALVSRMAELKADVEEWNRLHPDDRVDLITDLTADVAELEALERAQ